MSPLLRSDGSGSNGSWQGISISPCGWADDVDGQAKHAENGNEHQGTHLDSLRSPSAAPVLRRDRSARRTPDNHPKDFPTTDVRWQMTQNVAHLPMLFVRSVNRAGDPRLAPCSTRPVSTARLTCKRIRRCIVTGSVWPIESILRCICTPAFLAE